MLELKLLIDSDIPLVEKWLSKEHVKKWYEIPAQDVTLDDWIYELKERNGEFKWLNHLIVMWHGHPIGMCQYYKCEDSIDEDFGSLPRVGSYGIDYLIGEEDYLGKGLGREMILLLVKKIFCLPDAKRVTADIDKNNKASEGVLLSCGFKICDEENSRYVLLKESQY